MKVLEFISKLSTLAISVSRLMEIGYSNEYANALNEAFYPTKTTRKSSSSDCVIQLVEEYDSECIGLISPIKFDKEVTETENYFLIGWLREDLIAVDKKNNEVIILAYWDTDLVAYYCSQTTDKFLEAFLIHGIGAFGMKFDKEEDQWAYNEKKAKEASIAAGGDKYLNFWIDLYPTNDNKSDALNSQGLLN